MPKFVIQYEVKLTDGSFEVELEEEPSYAEAKRILDDLSGAELVENASLSPPEVEVFGIYAKRSK